MDYLSLEQLRKDFFSYLMEVQGLDPDEAQIAVEDFPNPYGSPFLREEFLYVETIDGEDYECNASCVDFSMSYTFSNSKPYRFYTYYKCADLEPNHTVGDYKNAHKLFLPVDVEEINEDFPLQPSEEDDC